MEVQMRVYEDDVDKTLIEKKKQEGEEVKNVGE